MTWTFNRDYKDLAQVEEFYSAYLAVFNELRAAGRYSYNDSFKGRIPGIEGPQEDTGIYLLQNLRAVRELAAKIADYRAVGWRDVGRADLDGAPVRFAGIAEYGQCMGGTGWHEWGSARLTRYHGSVMVLPGRNRTSGHLVSGRLIVKN
jgi:hypothetical protein